MSVSDAAPLPRLGEVFFDVRGNSRSMRLSWYADTGVAVFSIWQAGMCTGTFRLPMGDLQRMIGILERGPAPQGRERPPVTGASHAHDHDAGRYAPDQDELGLLDSATGPAGYSGPGQRGQSGLNAPYGAGDEGTAAYPAADYEAGYPDEGYGRAASARADSGRADGGMAGQGAGGYGQDGYLSADGVRAADYGAAADYGVSGNPPADYGVSGNPPADYGVSGNPPADYGVSGNPPADYRARGNPPADYRAGGNLPGGNRDGAYPAAGYGADNDVSRRGPDSYGIPGSRDYGQEYPPGDQARSRSSRSAGLDEPDYPAGGYRPGASDYATSEHPLAGHRDVGRAEDDAAYPAAGYGSHRDSQAGGHRRSAGGSGPDPGGQALAGQGEASYRDERFVPPYVRGSEEPYRGDRRSEAGSHERDPGDAGYPEDRPSVWPSDDYVEPPWPQESYSNGAEYRHR
jgi:hypothetical protein